MTRSTPARSRSRASTPAANPILADPSASLVDATERALADATHLTGKDAGAVQALRVLARKIDTEANLRELALQYAEEYDMKPPHVDNVSIPTYLKYATALGLIPAPVAPTKPAEGGKSGQLAKLRSA